MNTTNLEQALGLLKQAQRLIDAEDPSCLLHATSSIQDAISDLDFDVERVREGNV